MFHVFVQRFDGMDEKFLEIRIGREYNNLLSGRSRVQRPWAPELQHRCTLEFLLQHPRRMLQDTRRQTKAPPSNNTVQNLLYF